MLKSNNKYEIFTPSGWQPFSGIQKVTHNKIIAINTKSGLFIEVSINHKFTCGDIITEASYLGEGDCIDTAHGIDEIIKIEYIDGEFELYDPLDVGKDSLYYANDIVNHNCEFIGSMNTLISPVTLRNMPYFDPIYSRNGLDIYEEPKDDKTYNIVVDVARGKGLDYSACIVMDTTAIPYKLVAKYRSNLISPMLFPDILNSLGMKYNMAQILIEVNDIGGQVADTLHLDLEYPNVMFSSTKGRGGQTLGGGFATNVQFGVRTTQLLKRVGCSSLKTLLEDGKIHCPDFDIIAELSSFVQHNNTYQAEEGQHDDLVMCLVIFSWMVTQAYFKELNVNNIREVMRRGKLSDEDLSTLTPFGLVNAYNPIEYVIENGERWEVVDEFPGIIRW